MNQNDRLPKVIKKMWAHSRLMIARLEAHHRPGFYRGECEQCLVYEFQFNRWSKKAYDLTRSLHKEVA